MRMYHTLGSHTGCAVGDISQFVLYFTMNLSHSLQNEHTLLHFCTQMNRIIVRYVNSETRTSECANVSHIWLPYWVRSRVTHSLCLVFYNEFDTFAKKLTTVTHLGHPREWNAVRVVNIETLISDCANISHIWLPYWARSRGYLSLWLSSLQGFCDRRFKCINFT